MHFYSKLSKITYKLLWVRKMTTIDTRSYHPNVNGGVERVNHTMAQILAMMVNEREDGWDIHNNPNSTATGLAPNEVHMNHPPHLPMTIVEHQ